MTTLLDDVRSAWRLLARHSGVSTALAVTMAGTSGFLGVAASLSAALLSPGVPGVAEPSRVVAIYGSRSGEVEPARLDDFRAVRDRRVLPLVAAEDRMEPALLRVNGSTHNVRATSVFGDFAEVLGFSAPPRQGVLPRAILSATLHASIFQPGEDAIGRRLHVGTREYAIALIAPAGFTGLTLGAATGVWIEASPDALPPSEATLARLTIAGRMAPGTGIAAVRAALDAAAGAGRLVAVPFAELDPSYRAAMRPIGLILLMAGLMVFAAGLANVATLTTCSYARRTAEFATRESLGGTARRLFRQLWFEGLIIALIACGLGGVLAFWLRQVVFAWLSPEQAAVVARHSGFAIAAISAAAFLACASVCLICAQLGCRLGWPLPAGRRDDLVRSARTASSHRAVVAVQVACACSLLVGAGLLTTFMQQALTTGPGHLADQVVVVETVAPTRYADPARGRRFQREALTRVATLPGVTSAAWTATLPLVSASRTSFAVDGAAPLPYRTIVVSAGYFETMAHPVVEGREFAAMDDAVDGGNVVVNEAFAARVFPGGALGRAVVNETGRRHTIIGVVANARYRRLEEPIEPTVYLPYSGRYLSGLYLVARVSGDVPGMLATIGATLRTIDSAELRQQTTLEAHLQSAVRRDRVATVIVWAAALLVVGMAITGPFQLTRHVVLSRRTELAVRMALGARGAVLVRLVVKQTLALTIIGVLVGQAAALAVLLLSSGASLPSSVVWRAFAVGAVAVGVTGALSALVPALAATRIQPRTAIR